MGALYLIRHGQASVLSDNYDQLSDKGKEQSMLTGAYLSNRKIPFDKVYYGPLKRHKQTLDGIVEGMGKAFPSTILLPELKEHQGYKLVKSILPDLISKDKEIRKLASDAVASRENQIQMYLRLYEKLSTRWVNNQLDGIADKFESWLNFRNRADSGLKKILSDAKQGQNIAVITSGGPISTSVGNALNLDHQKTMELSWVIHNCSISSFLFRENRFSLSTFNSTHHFDDKALITIV